MFHFFFVLQTGESSEFLPLVDDPDTISAYCGKRPRAVASRVIQLLSVAGGFLSRLAGDVINKKVQEVVNICSVYCFYHRWKARAESIVLGLVTCIF